MLPLSFLVLSHSAKPEKFEWADIGCVPLALKHLLVPFHFSFRPKVITVANVEKKEEYERGKSNDNH